jgi:hypothetical protein
MEYIGYKEVQREQKEDREEKKKRKKEFRPKTGTEAEKRGPRKKIHDPKTLAARSSWETSCIHLNYI